MLPPYPNPDLYLYPYPYPYLSLRQSYIPIVLFFDIKNLS